MLFVRILGWFHLVIFSLVLHAADSGQYTSQFSVKPTPDWVKVRSVDTSFTIPLDKISDGVFYRLVDDQIKISKDSTQHYYVRYVESIINPKGLDESSQIEIAFDPTYESLIIHDISIIRQGQREDRFGTADVSVFQREEDLEQRIYNGEVTFSAILQDIAVGDTVDFSYTIVGRNPIYQGLFSAGRTIVWSVPVQDQFHRVLWGKDTPLFYQAWNTEKKPVERIVGDDKEYEIHQHMVATSIYSSQSPSWFIPRANVYYSETKTWADVNEWARPLYANLGADDEVRAVATAIAQQGATKKDQLGLALKYVQENIRYVGIEIGQNSHLPTPASETLQLKYGDCKDKTVLLLALLKELGISSMAALVNTDISESLVEVLPSVSRFDHVIVWAKVAGEVFWLDPTMSNQFGPIDAIYQPDFGYALLVSPTEKTLTDMNASQLSSVEVEEVYHIPSKIDEPATLEVNSTYLGSDAQYILSKVQNSGIERVGKDYLEYYQRSFTNTKSLQPVELLTDETNGRVRLSELYQIDGIFSETDDGFEIDFYANDIRSEVAKPDAVQRNAPFSLDYPSTLRNKIVLKFAEDNWDFDNAQFKEDNDFFNFSSNIQFVDNVLTLDYQYYSKQDHVSANRIEEYLEARNRVRDNSSYGIIKYRKGDSAASSDPEQGGEYTEEFTYLIWYMVAAAVLFCLMVIDWRFYAVKRKDTEHLQFQPIPFWKFYLLGVVTFGLYCSYWIYRNWLLLNKRHELDIWPIARGIFSVFWLYPLYTRLQEFKRNSESISCSNTKSNPVLISSAVAVLLAISYFALNAISSISEDAHISFLVTVLLPLVFWPFVRFINAIHTKQAEDVKWGAAIGARHVFISLIFLPLLLMYVTQITYLTPTSAAIEGSKLWQHDIKFLQRKKLLSAKEQLKYFYSDALFSVRNDGNGFTDKKVFSYWLDDDSGFVAESAEFDAVKDIQVQYSTDEFENTLVTVVRHDDSEFLLYVSPTDKKDKVFAENLMAQWRQKKSE